MRTEVPKLPPDAIAALRRGRKVEAIKLTRAATGMGLRESRDAVEAVLRDDPAMREAFRLAAGQTASSSLPLLGFVIVVTLLIYWFVFRE